MTSHSAWRMAMATLAVACCAMPLQAETVAGIDLDHQQALIRTVRQDCGACHGMQLTGGLGPPLTSAALADRPLSSVVAVILFGRAGTPMPGWHTMLSEADAQWIARQLQRGFPQEARP